jgi:hypothetical protein
MSSALKEQLQMILQAHNAFHVVLKKLKLLIFSLF